MPDYAVIVTGCFAAAVLCVAVQYCVKRLVPFQQYGYFRDVLLAGAWLLLAVWFGSPSARAVVGGAFLAGVAGLSEGFYPGRPWRLCYLLIGVLCALFGPSIHFIRFADGEYVYLAPTVSLALTALWFFLFPLLFQHLDAIPGLTGYVLAVTFALMLMACLLMGGLSEGLASGAFFMAFAGLTLLGAFWSRFGNVYRQAGRALSSMWSVLVAGTAILGNSKGIVFSSLFFLSLGLFAIPIVELSLYWVSRMFTEAPDGGAERLYRRVTGRGLEHPEAVRFVAGVCALVSVAVALFQTPPQVMPRLCWGVAGVCALAVVLPPLFKRRRAGIIPPNDLVLWGVPFDNMSMNYAVTRARGLILNPMGGGAQLVATVNALGMEEAVRDKGYRRVLQEAAMVLADGTGLLWGMRFLGMPIQERVTGIDFAEQLCRAASAEGWPVYFLGAKGDTARRCADALASRYPGLVVAGARDGYFDVEDTTIPEVVAASGAKVLLVAMGLPRQEKWVAAHRERLGPMLTVGVGGAFDVFSGSLSRAPAWAQRAGLEWLYRLFQEPFRWRKDLGLARFVLRVLMSKLRLYPVREEPR
ncbi:MAG: WecB/TagA/CpsF family glycosyltransferase [Synergistaceae bacterium]|nr:WecB/TagA/CpsF family glycosyltransferase [Synergistaceae bacterium]